MLINYKLADGVEIVCDVEFKDFNANVSMRVAGTATIRETTWSGRTLEETTSCQVSFANARYNAVVVNFIDLYNPPTAFLDHLPHRHRAYDDEADCWLDTAPCPSLRLTRQDAVRIEDLANAVHRAYRDDLKAGRKTLNNIHPGDWTPAYDYLQEQVDQDIIRSFDIRATDDGRVTTWVWEPIPETERTNEYIVNRQVELPAEAVAGFRDRYETQLGRSEV